MAIKHLQAREIVREAKRLGIKMSRMSVYACVNGVINQSYNGGYLDMQAENLSRISGFNQRNLNMLEAGFEGRKRGEVNYQAGPIDINHRYYKVGQRVAKLAGLSSR